MHLIIAYSMPLAVLSLVVAIVHAYVAMELLDRTLLAGGRQRGFLLTVTAVTLGTGIWSMHFIGIMAWEPSEGASYHTVGLAASLIISCLSAWIGFYVYLSQMAHKYKLRCLN
ncbi:MAG: bifunctional diguanylate cyclase/phosphodiesterase [Paenibacillus sp.]|nr:bifunctional diguanylate cyclase/phosphodiesterase [Paenibacillus sp.]